MVDEKGVVNSNALKVRITDNYLDALRKIYHEVKIVGLPTSKFGGTGTSDTLSPENIATAMVMYQHVMGGKGGSSGGSLSPDDVTILQQQVSQLTSAVSEVKDAA